MTLCLLPALALAQNVPADAGRQDPRDGDQSYQDQSYNDQGYNDVPADQPPAAPAAVPQPVKHSPEGFPVLEDGTPVRLRLSRTLSSADCRVGDRVDFKVVDPIVMDGVTVVPQESIAWGKIIEAEHKKRLARGGKLAVMIESVRLANSDKAPLRAVREAEGKGHTGLMGGAMLGTVVVVPVLWPAAPLFLLMHGRDVKISEGTEITAYVNGDTVYNPNPSVYGQRPAPPAQMRTAAPAPVTAEAAAPETVATPADAPLADSAPVDTAPMEAVPAEAAPLSTELTFTSTPEGAEIELDGSYVGRTPSTIGVPGGEHTVRLSKHGYQPYERRLETAGGSEKIHADMQAGGQ